MLCSFKLCEYCRDWNAFFLLLINISNKKEKVTTLVNKQPWLCCKVGGYFWFSTKKKKSLVKKKNQFLIFLRRRIFSNNKKKKKTKPPSMELVNLPMILFFHLLVVRLFLLLVLPLCPQTFAECHQFSSGSCDRTRRPCCTYFVM